MPQSSYPLDITGINSANRVSNELHSVQIPTGPMAAFIVPTFAPFHGNPTYVTIKHGQIGNQTTLTYGVDYVFKHQFRHAKDQLDKDFYGSVMFLNRNLSGEIRMTYNTLGGDYTLDSTQVIIDRTNSMLALQTVLWDQIVGVPVALPPTGHTHPPDELMGWDDLITKMDEVIVAVGDVAGVTALVQTVKQMIEAHVADENNPHATNKAKILLGNVQNYPIANGVQSIDSSNNSTYATPRTIWLMLNEKIEGLIQPFLDDLPVDAESIGLGSVQNLGVATAAEAYAAQVNKYLTANTAKSTVGGQMLAEALSTNVRTRDITTQNVVVDDDHPDHPGVGEVAGEVIINRTRLPGSGGWLETAHPKVAGHKATWRRVVTSASSPAWARFTYGIATISNVFQSNANTVLATDVLPAAVSAGLHRPLVETNAANMANRTEAQFIFSGTIDGTAGHWRIQNVYYESRTVSPNITTPRCQIATLLPPKGSAEATPSDPAWNPTILFREISNSTSTVWSEMSGNAGPEGWSPAQTSDMAYNTTVSDKYVAPVNVREHVNSRLGEFVQRVSVSSSSPDATGARVGDIHFQIV